MSNINLNCDVCGREVRGYTWINGMRFCAKCYQETFSNTLTTQQLLDFIKNSGWGDRGLSNVKRLDKEAHDIELQQKVKVLEKALELACQHIWALSVWENSEDEVIKDNVEYFKTKAKEMMKSE